jgi:hypothetical protein
MSSARECDHVARSQGLAEGGLLSRKSQGLGRKSQGLPSRKNAIKSEACQVSSRKIWLKVCQVASRMPSAHDCDQDIIVASPAEVGRLVGGLRPPALQKGSTDILTWELGRRKPKPQLADFGGRKGRMPLRPQNRSIWAFVFRLPSVQLPSTGTRLSRRPGQEHQQHHLEPAWRFSTYLLARRALGGPD